MNKLARLAIAAPSILAVSIPLLACGSAKGWTSGSNGNAVPGAGSSFGNGTGGLVGGGPTSGGTVGNGNNPAGSPTVTAEGQSCSAMGANRICCTGGIQYCQNSGEFMIWGPCVDSNHNPLACSRTPDCSNVAEGPNHVCDGGGGGGDGSAPPPPSLCNDPSVNTEPGILVAYSPAPGQAVGSSGQIKLWVNDEGAPFISPNEQIDPVTGAVTVPGDRTAVAPDGLLYEPAIYFAPQTPLNGGTPYFPQWIKGWYNNQPTNFMNSGPQAPGATSSAIQGPAIDTPPLGTRLMDRFTAEDIWDVAAFGLSPGTYTAVFVIHDGDRDRGIGCVTVVIN